MESVTVSMSALKAYLRCPQKAWLTYVRGLQDARFGGVRVALDFGSQVHEHLRRWATDKVWPEATGDPLDPADVAAAWIENRAQQVFDEAERPLQTPAGELALDRPCLVPTDLRVQGRPVFLRATFDVATYNERDPWTRILDYKTFSRQPSYDIDLDFQGRTYCGVAWKLWSRPVLFEKQFMRNASPGAPRGKEGKACWKTSECYFSASMLLSEEECAAEWRRTLETLGRFCRDVAAAGRFESASEGTRHTVGEALFPRVPLAAGGYTDCGFCEVKQNCIARLYGPGEAESEPHDTIFTSEEPVDGQP